MPRPMESLQRRLPDGAEKELVAAASVAEFQQGLAAFMEREGCAAGCPGGGATAAPPAAGMVTMPPVDEALQQELDCARAELAEHAEQRRAHALEPEGDAQMGRTTPRAPPTPRRRPAPAGPPATPEPSAKWLAASSAAPMTPDRGGRAAKAPPSSPGPLFCVTPKARADRRSATAQEALALQATPDTHLRKAKDTPPPAPMGLARRKQEELHHAVRTGDTAVLKMALQQGHHCGCAGTHFVHEAVRHQHLPALRLLLQEGHACDDHCNGRRPLHLAVQTCMVEGDQGHQMAKLLLEHGARPCAVPGDDLRKCSPLTDAAQRCCAPAVALLLAHGADPNQADLRGDTPLHIACRYAHPARGPPLPHAEALGRTVQERIVDLLVQKGANPSQKDHAGQPPIAHIPKQSSCLREKLRRAERWWCRRGFQVICAHFARDHQFAEAAASAACLGKADIAQVIGSYF